MSEFVRIKWDGDEFVNEVVEVEDDAVSMAGAYMTGAVRAEIRSQDLIDTGFLINSIDDEPSGPRTQKIGTNAHYAVYLEYGTRYMGAKAFMRRSMDDGTNQTNVMKIVVAALKGLT